MRYPDDSQNLICHDGVSSRVRLKRERYRVFSNYTHSTTEHNDVFQLETRSCSGPLSVSGKPGQRVSRSLAVQGVCDEDEEVVDDKTLGQQKR